MTVSTNEVLEVIIEATLADGTIVQNRKHFLTSFAAPLSDSTVLNAIKTWVETLYAYVATYVPSTTALEQGTVVVKEWNESEGFWETARNVGTYTPLDTFADATDELPNQVAAFVVGHTLRPKTKGRMFVFPFGEDSQDHGALVAGAITALANFATQYMTDQAIGADLLASIVVRELVNAKYEIQSTHYDDILGTQRRRRRGQGI